MADGQERCGAGQTLAVQDGLIARRDVTGDRIADVILDLGFLRCGQDDTAPFCGSGGCWLAVFGSRSDGGHEMVFEDVVRSARFLRVKGKSAMLLDLHSIACRKVGAESCQKTLLWDGERFAWPER